MTFVYPWVLLALLVLPVLWWLLRVTPPAPRTEIFPAIRLLLGIKATEETAARTPWWLLALRMAAAGLIIVGLARPLRDTGSALPGQGPLLLVIDDGWAAAHDWPQRMEAASAVLDRAERAGRPTALLATAPGDTGAPPQPTVLMPAADLRSRLGALRPKPWPVERGCAAVALRDWQPSGAAAIYISDGLAQAEADDAAFADALAALGQTVELCCDGAPVRALLPPRAEPDRLIARLAQTPLPVASDAAVLAQSGDGRTLARAAITVPPGAGEAEATIALPTELRNGLARLVLEGAPSAGAVTLLDERWRRRPVGLIAGDAAAAEAPLTGPLYYLRRALAPYTEVREGDARTLTERDLSVLILADRPLRGDEERSAITRFVDKGGLLIRFAGPHLAEQAPESSDQLLPVHLLAGDRQLGGAMSWSKPASLAAFPDASPFAGLGVPAEVSVSRQVLAEPSATLAQHTWAALADGTPLVTEATRGAGRVVLFHVTANADWSNLPLSGLFVDMLRRLVDLSVGVAGTPSRAVLAPAEALDGFGTLAPPPASATGLAADAFARTPVSPLHPPGLYGPESGRRALNVGAALPPLRAMPPMVGARVEGLAAVAPERAIGGWLIGAAILLLAADLLISLALRGLLRRPGAIGATVALLVVLAPAPRASALEQEQNPALATHLAYIVTGDDQVDGVSRAGLEGLSDYVNRRTAATLVEPTGVVPGRDDLSFFPLLYWPITPDAQPLPNASIVALNDYTSRGGILLIDTRDSGSGSGFAPGADEALRRAVQGLTVPPLAPLTTEHVLARAFYLLQEFSGRYAGGTVWVQRDQDRANDSVSPVIIGGNDWASAWATDPSGRNPYAVIPGGARQRTLAYRFGVNLVMYALTGNYKGDQVHVPAILERLGQ